MSGFYLASMFDFFGLQYISAGMERLVLFTFPTIVLIISALFLKQKIQKIQGLAVLITYIGIAIAFYEGVHLEDSQHFVWGVFLVFLAVSCSPVAGLIL